MKFEPEEDVEEEREGCEPWQIHSYPEFLVKKCGASQVL